MMFTVILLSGRHLEGPGPLGILFPTPHHHLTHWAGGLAAVCKGAQEERATPSQLHPGAATGLGMAAGRGIADRAQVLSPGLSQAVLSASRESHQQPSALCALAAYPRKRCLQKSPRVTQGRADLLTQGMPLPSN